MQHFTIEALHEDQLAEAAAIVRMAMSNCNPEWWEESTRELIDRGGGVLAARAGDRSIYGVATYEVVKRRHTGPVLTVETLASFDLSRKQPVKQALVDALDMISTVFGCRAMAVPLPSKSHMRFVASPRWDQAED